MSSLVVFLPILSRRAFIAMSWGTPMVDKIWEGRETTSEWHAAPNGRTVPFNLKVLAKFGHYSNCSQKLDECSLARSRKSFVTARMLGFSRMANLRNIGERFTRYECFWKHASWFCWRFIETDVRNNSSRKAPAKVESNLETWRHVEYYYYYSTFRACQSCLTSIGWILEASKWSLNESINQWMNRWINESMKDFIKVSIALSLKKIIIGDTVYTMKYTLSKVKIIYNVMHNV